MRDVTISGDAAKPVYISSEKDITIRASAGARGIVIIDMKEGKIAVKAEAESDVTVVTLLKAGTTKQTVEQHATVGEGATIRWQNVTVGGGEIEQRLTSEVKGRNGTSSIDWIVYATKKDRIAVSAKNVFHAQNGGGEISVRGVAADTAIIGCDGAIVIGEKGTGTQTYLTQGMLMLHPTAKIDAIPALEIKTNDVKASHSATITKISAADVFYFASRGIDARDAETILIRGFLEELLERFPLPVRPTAALLLAL